MSSILNITQLNALSDEEFEYIFKNVIELRPDAAIAVQKERPFNNSASVCVAFDKYLDILSISEKTAVLKSHPDLAGKVAQMGELTPESTREQTHAGLHLLNPEQKRMINFYNESYKKKFGFPFIICARENKISTILAGLESRLRNSSHEELLIAINEVKKICKYRIYEIIEED